MKRLNLKLVAFLILAGALLAFIPTVAQENDLVTVGEVFAPAVPAEPGAPWYAGLLASAASALIGFVMWAIKRGVAAMEAATAEKAKTSQTWRYIAKAEKFVDDAVLAVLAKLEPSLKKKLADGKLTKHELDELKDEAFDAVKAYLGDSWKDIAARFHMTDGGLAKWIMDKIVARFAQAKPGN